MAGDINRRSLETLVCAGAFDSFGYSRKQFFTPGKSGELFIDELVRYAALYKEDQMDSSASLFGEVEEMKPVRPEIPQTFEEEDLLEKLQKEKEFVGMYLSSHPLDRYAFEIENFTTHKLSELPAAIDELQASKSKPVKAAIAGIVMDVKRRTTKSNTQGAVVTLEDFSGSYEIALFGKDFEKFIPYMEQHAQIFIEGEIAEKYFIKPEDRAQGKTSPYTFKMKNLSLLGNLTGERLTGISLVIDTEKINPEFRKDLAKLLKANQGKTPLMIYLQDRSSGYKLEMKSKKYSVSVSEDFISRLSMLGIPYKVGKK